jgi:hypothetical protein
MEEQLGVAAAKAARMDEHLALLKQLPGPGSGVPPFDSSGCPQ